MARWLVLGRGVAHVVIGEDRRAFDIEPEVGACALDEVLRSDRVVIVRQDVVSGDASDPAQVEEQLLALVSEVLHPRVAAGVRAIPGVVTREEGDEVHGSGEHAVGVEVVVDAGALAGELLEELAHQPGLHRGRVGGVGPRVRVQVQGRPDLVGLPEAQEEVGGSLVEVDDRVVRVLLVPQLAEARHLHERLPQVVRAVRDRNDELHGILAPPAALYCLGHGHGPRTIGARSVTVTRPPAATGRWAAAASRRQSRGCSTRESRGCPTRESRGCPTRESRAASTSRSQRRTGR